MRPARALARRTAKASVEDSPIDLVLLQTFYEIARNGSVTKAARQLGRSQPAISHRLRALETSLGVKLFEKAGRCLKLTDFGRRLESECMDIMGRSQGIRERVVGSEAGIQGQVTIGTLPTVAAHLLVPMLASLLDRHPDVTVRFRMDYLEALAERLRIGQIDVMVAIGEVESPGLEVLTVGVVELALVLSPTLAKSLPSDPEELAPSELAGHRYLAFGGERDPTFATIDAYAREHGFTGPRTPRIPHIETLRELAAAGVGFAILPSYTARRDCRSKRLVTRRLRGLDQTLEISLVGRRDQVLTPALREVRRALAAALSDSAESARSVAKRSTSSIE